MDFAGPIPFPVLQSLFDGLYPAGLQWYWKADFFKELSDKAIDLHVKYGGAAPEPALDHAPLPDQRRRAPRRARATPP